MFGLCSCAEVYFLVFLWRDQLQNFMTVLAPPTLYVVYVLVLRHIFLCSFWEIVMFYDSACLPTLFLLLYPFTWVDMTGRSQTDKCKHSENHLQVFMSNKHWGCLNLIIWVFDLINFVIGKEDSSVFNVSNLYCIIFNFLIHHLRPFFLP